MSLDDDELSAAIRAHATRHAAPDRLRAAIRTQTALAEAGRTDTKRPDLWRPGRWVAAARRRAVPISFASGMLCMALLLPVLSRWEFGEPRDADAVAEHVRALSVGPVADVLSTDRHTVKPWFQGRLDFAPPVPDLAAEGYPLVGGRTGRLRGQAVAALVYRRNQHLIDLFVRPGTDDPRAPVRSLNRGFQVIHWADGSMQYWAVSDMDGREFEDFVRRWRERAAAR